MTRCARLISSSSAPHLPSSLSSSSPLPPPSASCGGAHLRRYLVVVATTSSVTPQPGEEYRQPRNRPWLPPAAPLAPSGRQGASHLLWRSSASVERFSVQLPPSAQSGGELPPEQLRRTSARVATTSGVVAPSSSSRMRAHRSQLPSTARVYEKATQQGHA